MDGTAIELTGRRTPMQSKIHLKQRYPHPRAKVWRALTEPALLQKWCMRPEGFAPVVGTRFKLVEDGKHRGWRGFVECEVLEVEHERRLKISWVGDEKDAPQTVTYTLADVGAGTLLTLDHEGFEGLGGFVLAKLILTPGWKSMLRKRLAKAIGGAA